MILFDIAKFITPNILKVKAAIDSTYTGVKISDMYIDTEDTVLSTGPNIADCVYHESFDAASIDVDVDLSDIVKAGSHLYFIYLKVEGIPVPEPPCGLDRVYTLAMTYDGARLYKDAISLIKCQKGCGCMDNQCEVSAKLVNFALEWFRLNTSIELGLSTEALDSFNRISGKNVTSKTVYSNCGCNGD